VTSAETLSPFVIGIDLGTTNSAMACIDTTSATPRVQTFAVPQAVAAGQVEARPTLPSFHYQPEDAVVASGYRLPWQTSAPTAVVGFAARDQAPLCPGRVIGSAKSWLCHAGVDRTAPLLPWQSHDDVERLSPVAVSAAYLQHLRDAWDAAHPNAPLAEQDVVLTLPASFDEVARDLTVRAARLAGLNRVVLLEEPQAAFYSWIDRHPQDWQQRVSAGQKILICDVGGGTTDFTLLRVRQQPEGLVQFHRVAVGEHLILGGDNIDLAIAHHLERQLAGSDRQLEPRVWSALVRSCRQLKETLLGEHPPDQTTLVLPGSGSRLIGGSRQVVVRRVELEHLVLEGFFPRVLLSDRPRREQSGFQEFGLPYARDAAITRYLAHFLSTHRHAGELPEESQDRRSNLLKPARADSRSLHAAPADPARPDHLLFNGGVFESPLLRDRLVQQLEAWFPAADGAAQPWTITVLDHDRLDLAVARGAAYYGLVRRGQGVRIAAGLPRSYYIGAAVSRPVSASHSTESESGSTPAGSAIEPSSAPGMPEASISAAEAASVTAVTHDAATTAVAVCLCPAGLEPGEELLLSHPRFQLQLAQPIEFPLFVSSTRMTDRPGDQIAIEPEQLTALPPLRTVLKTHNKSDGDTAMVQLQARLTEIGTLDLWCQELDSGRRWKLLFDVRSATQTDVIALASVAASQGVFDESLWEAGEELLRSTFTQKSSDPAGLMKLLSAAFQLDKSVWPTPLLRQLWEQLMAVEPGRRLSAAHELRWWNLLGFCLRPGYGYALDDWRVAETWKRLYGKLAFPSAAHRTESWILWRRLAGGLTSGQQQALCGPLLSSWRDGLRTAGKSRGDVTSPQEWAEQFRCVGSCEWLSAASKRDFGELSLQWAESAAPDVVRAAAVWCVGRLGARRPVYGPLNTVVSADIVSNWIRRVSRLPAGNPWEAFAVMLMARRTDDRYRDVSSQVQSEAAQWLKQMAAPPRFVELVQCAGNLDSEQQGLVFGESLPPGLTIL
jgi:hypothetical protein